MHIVMVAEAPEFVVRDGNAFITYRSGNDVYALAMPANVFRDAIDAAQNSHWEWEARARAEQRKIVPIRKGKG